MRHLYGSISDWDQLFQEAFKACKPGGWVESTEGDPRIYTNGHLLDEPEAKPDPEPSAINQWGRVFLEYGRMSGRTFHVVQEDIQNKCMDSAGFTDIRVKDFVVGGAPTCTGRQANRITQIPIGGWSKDPNKREIGRYMHCFVDEDYEGFFQFPAQESGWDPVKIAVYCARLRNEVRSGEYHPYCRQKTVYGRKPGAP